MKANYVFGGGLALAASIALAPPSMTTVAAQEGKGLPLRLRAFAVDLNTNTARPNPGSNRTTNTVDIVIERWSTPEEVEKLRGALMEEPDRRGRSTVLLPALQAIRPRCGFARTSTSLGWDIQYAREIPIEGGGRRIVVATDRPIEMWEARNNTPLAGPRVLARRDPPGTRWHGSGHGDHHGPAALQRRNEDAGGRELPDPAGAPQQHHDAVARVHHQ